MLTILPQLTIGVTDLAAAFLFMYGLKRMSSPVTAPSGIFVAGHRHAGRRPCELPLRLQCQRGGAAVFARQSWAGRGRTWLSAAALPGWPAKRWR